MSAPANVFTPAPHQLRDIVIDYLLSNCYTNAAKAFARETAASNIASAHSPAPAKESSRSVIDTVSPEDGDINMDDSSEVQPVREPEQFLPKELLRLVELRREIKMHILCGRIEDAIQMLNTHFPSVLQDPESEGESDEYGVSRTNPSGTATNRVPLSSLSRAAESSSGRGRIPFTSQCSTKPIHLVLNLQILAFIEAARSIPLPYPPSTSYGSGSPHLRPNPSSRSMSATSTYPSSDEQQTALLHHAQRLYAKVQSLKDPRDREPYRKEMENVVGLLAYRVPEKSPMVRYMKQERRDAVADQINSAILHRLGQPAASLIEIYARHTSVVFDYLRSMKRNLPPPSLRPANIATALQAMSASSPDVGSMSKIAQIKSERERENNELFPAFELSKFLGS